MCGKNDNSREEIGNATNGKHENQEAGINKCYYDNIASGLENFKEKDTIIQLDKAGYVDEDSFRNLNIDEITSSHKGVSIPESEENVGNEFTGSIETKSNYVNSRDNELGRSCGNESLQQPNKHTFSLRTKYIFLSITIIMCIILLVLVYLIGWKWKGAESLIVL